MYANPGGSRASFVEPFQAYLSDCLQNEDRHPRVDPEQSTAALVKALQSFDDELRELRDDDREALLAVFRRELKMLLLHFRLEAATMRFLPRSR